MKTIRLSKLDVAQRQLRTAIELWFIDGDPVSIHALAFSAHEVIHVLYKKEGHKDLLFDTSFIKNEYLTEFNRFIKKSANFIKHARNDSDGTLDFDPTLSDLFLMMSITGLATIGAKLSDVEAAYSQWLQLHHPTWFRTSIFKEGVPVEIKEFVRSIPKKDFLKVYLEIRRQARQI